MCGGGVPVARPPLRQRRVDTPLLTARSAPTGPPEWSMQAVGVWSGAGRPEASPGSHCRCDAAAETAAAAEISAAAEINATAGRKSWPAPSSRRWRRWRRRRRGHHKNVAPAAQEEAGACATGKYSGRLGRSAATSAGGGGGGDGGGGGGKGAIVVDSGGGVTSVASRCGTGLPVPARCAAAGAAAVARPAPAGATAPRQATPAARQVRRRPSSPAVAWGR